MPGASSTRVILHGDDMGATARVTERMLEAWERGLLSSFSVLANGEALPTVSRELAARPEREARIAVHLNVSEGPSTRPPSSVPLLVDGQGRLCRSFGDLLRALALSSSSERERLLLQIEAEWSGQIEAVRRASGGRPVAALDGHIHVHMLPHLLPLAVELARRHGIPEVRLSREVFHVSPRPKDSLSSSFALNVVKHLVLRGCAALPANAVGNGAVRFPDALVGVLYTGRMTAAAAAAGIARARRAGAREVEVVFHVGRADPAEIGRWEGLPEVAPFYLSADRDREYEELERLVAESPWLNES